MPKKCYTKPNRSGPRRWTAKTAAQAFCKARQYGARQDDFLAEVRARCGWDEGGDWRRKIQEILDALESVLEQLLKSLGPGFLAKILGKLYQLIPAPIRQLIESYIGRIAKALADRILDAIEKLRKLPPP